MSLWGTLLIQTTAKPLGKDRNHGNSSAAGPSRTLLQTKSELRLQRCPGQHVLWALAGVQSRVSCGYNQRLFLASLLWSNQENNSPIPIPASAKKM
ncbi:hypothetical protein LEMLEM_LOCUS14792, partial [Lemmus lemmus]